MAVVPVVLVGLDVQGPGDEVGELAHRRGRPRARDELEREGEAVEPAGDLGERAQVRFRPVGGVGRGDGAPVGESGGQEPHGR